MRKTVHIQKLFNVSGMFVPSVPYTKNTTQNMETLEPSWSLLDSRATRSITSSRKMSNLLHGPISTNQILPREKRVNRDIFGTSNLQIRTYGVSCDE